MLFILLKNHPTLEGDYSHKARPRYHCIIQKLSSLNQVKHFFGIITQFGKEVVFPIYNYRFYR